MSIQLSSPELNASSSQVVKDQKQTTDPKALQQELPNKQQYTSEKHCKVVLNKLLNKIIMCCLKIVSKVVV